MRDRWLVIITLIGLLGASCGSESTSSDTPIATDGVRIASFDFAESVLLAEMYAQVLEARGLPVIRLGVVGPREVVAPALEGGLVDVVPEYAGTATAHFKGPGDAGENVTADALLAERGLAMLKPSPAQNVNVFVVTADFAERHQLTRISDLASSAGTARFGGPVECPDRPLCLVGLESTYGLTFAEFVPLRSLAITAEALVTEEIEVGLMFSTAAALSNGSFVVLEDDRGLQPAENVVPLARVDAIDRWGAPFSDGLNALSDALTTAELQDLNRQIAQGDDPALVAESWLRLAGVTTD